MVILKVIGVNGVEPKPPQQVSFDETGGTIGRAPSNKLALPDPDRTVSRVHAQIVRRQGLVVIISRGTNELLIDGKALEIGEEIPLVDGALIEMGSYSIRAQLDPMSARAPGSTTL